MGTACHARGAPRILEEFERRIGVKAGETTEDLKFTLQTVNCLGCCALGPVVMIDSNYHKMTINNVPDVLMKYYQTKGKRDAKIS
jgi:NADH-quinone oxidoreductase subunit E